MCRVRRTTWWVALGLTILAPCAVRSAEARGGVYRGPGGAVPPGLRAPSDPMPPPPPPPSGENVAREPALLPEPPWTDMPAGPTSYGDWMFWYQQNREAFEGPAGPRQDLPDEVRERVLDAIVKEAARTDGDRAARAAALVALGKAATRAEHVEPLLGALARDPRVEAVVVESAALGLGLLRRTGDRGFLDAAACDRIRTALLALAGAEGTPGRTKAFALIAVGLLGDQPTAPQAAATTMRALVGLASGPHAGAAVPVAAMHAIPLQEGGGALAEGLALLRATAYGKDGGAQDRTGLLRRHALLALGRAGLDEDVAPLADQLSDPAPATIALRRSAAMGLVRLAMRASEEAGKRAVNALLAAAWGDPDETVRGWALAGAAAAAAERGNGRPLLDGTLLTEALLVQARFGSPHDRAFAAIGLGHLIGEPVLEGLPRAKALAVLEEGMRSGGARTPAPIAHALGMATGSDLEARARMSALLAAAGDPAADSEARGYAALGIGHAALRADTEVQTEAGAMLRARLAERRSALPMVLCATALGLFRDGGAVAALRDEVRSGPGRWLGAEAATALARIGTPAAAEALLGLAGSAEEAPQVRALAIAGLGRMLDREPVPSLARVTLWLDYRASTDAFDELSAIL